MSDRSPSYERAQAGADQLPVAGAQVVALLSRLWEAEDNAATALPDEADAHRAKQAKLAALIVAQGGAAPRSDEVRPILGASLPAKLAAELHAEYQKALASPHLDDALRAALTSLAAMPVT